MNYFGATKFPESSNMNGYWVRGENVYDVSTSSHIRFILDHLDDFDLTEEDVKKAYEETGEKMGMEGKAREMLIKFASKSGWIRVRHYIKLQDFWSIQCDDSSSRNSDIANFCCWAIEKGVMSRNEEVTISGYNSPDDSFTFDFASGGVCRFLSLLSSDRTKDY